MNQFLTPTHTIPSKEDIEHEVLKAARHYGEGTSVSEDFTQKLTVYRAGDGGYRVCYHYNFLSYYYFFSTEQFEGRATA
jgi:hypothetical protein